MKPKYVINHILHYYATHFLCLFDQVVWCIVPSKLYGVFCAFSGAFEDSKNFQTFIYALFFQRSVQFVRLLKQMTLSSRVIAYVLWNRRNEHTSRMVWLRERYFVSNSASRQRIKRKKTIRRKSSWCFPIMLRNLILFKPKLFLYISKLQNRSKLL